MTSATAVGKDWLKAHARTVKGKTVLKVEGKKRKLPRADLGPLARACDLGLTPGQVPSNCQRQDRTTGSGAGLSING